MKKAGVEVKVTKKALAEVLESDASKSSKMKQLFDLGYEVKDIATLMQVRYNFVYNVLSNYVNMNGIVVESNKKEGKKDQILELYKQGRTNKEISIELKTNYNYVFNVVKQFKADNPDVIVVTQEEAK